MQDVVEHHDIDTMDGYICICCKNSLQQKKTKMPDQACANDLLLHDIPQDLQHMTPLEKKSDLSMNSIHHNTYHEAVWWPLQK